MHQLSLLLICLIVLKTHSQENRVTINGQIQSEEIELQDIHIINKNSGQGTISKANGRFEIDAKLNDTLILTGIQFYSKEVEITSKIIHQKMLETSLFLKINELREIELKQHNLDGTLLSDSKKVPDSISRVNPGLLNPAAWDVNFTIVYDYDNVDRKKPPDASKLTNPNIPVGVDIIGLVKFITEPIINEIKKNRKGKRDIKYTDNLYQTAVKDAKENLHIEFGDLFFTNTLKIPILQIDSYINHCETFGIVDLYAKNKKMEVLDILLRESENYKRYN